jgi:hypothetical protein
MSKITDFKNPISGDKGNILSVADWTQNIFGVGVLIVAIAMGQYILSMINLPYIKKQPQPIFTQPATAEKGKVFI